MTSISSLLSAKALPLPPAHLEDAERLGKRSCKEESCKSLLERHEGTRNIMHVLSQQPHRQPWLRYVRRGQLHSVSCVRRFLKSTP